MLISILKILCTNFIKVLENTLIRYLYLRSLIHTSKVHLRKFIPTSMDAIRAPSTE